MNQIDLITSLIVACGALVLLNLIWFFNAEHHYRKRVAAERLAEQLAANWHAAIHRANLHQTAQIQATNRANLLAAHVTELEQDKASLEQRVLYQSSLLREASGEGILHMAVMDAPLKWLPATATDETYTINLN